MIDFSTLQGLTIPEGVVTEIKDASGRVLWMLSGGKVILEVEKITSDTYAGETTYTGEQFILLDIYPKSANSKVDVTYGGLTKTLTFSGTNTQQVYFGTFNGVSDEVGTPASGELTIDGGYKAFAIGTYKTYNSSASKTTTKYCSCITNITDWGGVNYIPNYAFYECTNLALTELPNGITSIGEAAFNSCTNLALTELPNSITSIGGNAFYRCTNLALTELPNSITSIGNRVFYGCDALALTELPSGITSIGEYAFYSCDALALTSLPEGVISIGNYAFNYCKNLALTSLPEGVVNIGDCAFAMGKDNKGMYDTAMGGVSFTLPSTVQSIGTTAFAGAYGDSSSFGSCYIKEITILATVPPTTTNPLGQAGPNHGGGSIIVPAGCGEAYKTAEGWNKYADQIVEAS